MSSGFPPNLLNQGGGQDARYDIERRQRNAEAAAKYRSDQQQLRLKARAALEQKDIGAQGRQMLDQVANAEAAAQQQAQQEALQAQGEGVSKALRENVKAQTGVDTNVKFDGTFSGLPSFGTSPEGDPTTTIGRVPVDAEVPPSVIKSYMEGVGTKGEEGYIPPLASSEAEAKEIARRWGTATTQTQMVPTTGLAELDAILGFADFAFGWGPGAYKDRESPTVYNWRPAREVLQGRTERARAEAELAGTRARNKLTGIQTSAAIDQSQRDREIHEWTEAEQGRAQILHDENVETANLEQEGLVYRNTQERRKAAQQIATQSATANSAGLTGEEQAEFQSFRNEDGTPAFGPRAEFLATHGNIVEAAKITADNNLRVAQTAAMGSKINLRDATNDTILDRAGYRVQDVTYVDMQQIRSNYMADWKPESTESNRWALNNFLSTFSGNLAKAHGGPHVFNGHVPYPFGVGIGTKEDPNSWTEDYEPAHEMLPVPALMDSIYTLNATHVSDIDPEKTAAINFAANQTARRNFWRLTGAVLPGNVAEGQQFSGDPMPSEAKIRAYLDKFGRDHGRTAQAEVRKILNLGKIYMEFTGIENNQFEIPYRPDRRMTDQTVQDSTAKIDLGIEQQRERDEAVSAIQDRGMAELERRRKSMQRKGVRLLDDDSTSSATKPVPPVETEIQRKRKEWNRPVWKQGETGKPKPKPATRTPGSPTKHPQGGGRPQASLGHKVKQRALPSPRGRRRVASAGGVPPNSLDPNSINLLDS